MGESMQATLSRQRPESILSAQTVDFCHSLDRSIGTARQQILAVLANDNRTNVVRMAHELADALITRSGIPNADDSLGTTGDDDGALLVGSESINTAPSVCPGRALGLGELQSHDGCIRSWLLDVPY